MRLTYCILVIFEHVHNNKKSNRPHVVVVVVIVVRRVRKKERIVKNYKWNKRTSPK